MSKYVAELSADPGHDMYWHDWIVIETETDKNAVEDVVRKVDPQPYDEQNDDDFSLEYIVASVQSALAAAGITATVSPAECVFLAS